MRTIINGFAAAAMLVAAPAFAEARSETPTPTAGGTPSEGVRDKRYCTVQAYTGSRVPKKICKTRAQWMDEDNFDPLAPQK